MLTSALLCCFIRYYAALYAIMLLYTQLCCFIRYYVALFAIILLYTVLHCSMRYHVALFYSMRYSAAPYASVCSLPRNVPLKLMYVLVLVVRGHSHHDAQSVR